MLLYFYIITLVHKKYKYFFNFFVNFFRYCLWLLQRIGGNIDSKVVNSLKLFGDRRKELLDILKKCEKNRKSVWEGKYHKCWIVSGCFVKRVCFFWEGREGISRASIHYAFIEIFLEKRHRPWYSEHEKSVARDGWLSINYVYRSSRSDFRPWAAISVFFHGESRLRSLHSAMSAQGWSRRSSPLPSFSWPSFPVSSHRRPCGCRRS